MQRERKCLAVGADFLCFRQHVLHVAGARELEGLGEDVCQVGCDGHGAQVKIVGLAVQRERQLAGKRFGGNQLLQHGLSLGHGLSADGDALYGNALQKILGVDDFLVFLRLLERELRLLALRLLFRGGLGGNFI